MQRIGARRATVAALAVATLAPFVLTGCEDAKDKAIGCGKLALAASRSIDELERAAVGSALDQDATEVTEKLESDVEKIKERAGNTDISKVADKVVAAAKEVHASLTENRNPDLSSLKEAGSELTEVCTNSD